MTATYYTDEGLRSVQQSAEQLIRRTINAGVPMAVWEAGLGWYSVANELCHELAEVHERTFEEVAAIVAILSPRTQWIQNLLAAEEVLKGDRDEAYRYALGSCVDKAFRFLDGDAGAAPSGPKVVPFWRNIMFPTAGDESVTIDSIMADFFGFTYGNLDRKGLREVLEQAIRNQAVWWDMRPNQMQAILWIIHRGKAN